MSLETLTLTLIGGGDSDEDLEYTLAVLSGVDNRQTKNALSISPPGAPPRENVLLGIKGQEADRTISFYVHDDGSDKANGTASAVSAFSSSTVETLAEQRRWLERYIHAPDFDAEWRLNHDTGDEYDNQEVFVERVEIPALQQDNPRWVEGRITLREGRSI